MAAPTLADLRIAFYNRFDEGATNYISTSEANTLINEGGARLYNWLVSAGEDYLWSEAQGQISEGNTDFALPSDFFKIIKVFLCQDGYYRPLRRLMPEEWRGATGRFGYITLGNYLRFSRCFTSPTMNVAVWYVPQYTDMVNDTDALMFPYIPGSAEYVVNYAVISARIKEESDTTALERRQDQITKLIEIDMQNRDMGRHQHAVDADNIQYWGLMWEL